MIPGIDAAVSQFLRECLQKMKEGISLQRKISAFDRTNLTSICSVYKENIVKNDSY